MRWRFPANSARRCTFCMPNSPVGVISEKAETRMRTLKKHFRVDSESVMSALKLCFLIQAVLAVPALAQTPSAQNSPLPSQAKQVHGLAVPVPKEIFHTFDQFREANWRGIKRPEVARWKSHGTVLEDLGNNTGRSRGLSKHFPATWFWSLCN